MPPFSDSQQRWALLNRTVEGFGPNDSVMFATFIQETCNFLAPKKLLDDTPIQKKGEIVEKKIAVWEWQLFFSTHPIPHGRREPPRFVGDRTQPAHFDMISRVDFDLHEVW